MTATETRQGIGVSPGTAYGPVVQVAPPVRPPENEPAVDDRDAALVDVRAAFESVAVALEAKAAHADDTAQQILSATALIARDKGLVKAAAKQLDAILTQVDKAVASPQPSKDISEDCANQLRSLVQTRQQAVGGYVF